MSKGFEQGRGFPLLKVMLWAIGAGVSGIVLFLLAFLVGAAPTAAPTAGQEAVLIYRPILYGKEGVDPTPIKTGRAFVAWTTQVQYVDMFPQQFPIHVDDFMSKDGVPLDFDAVIRLQVTDSVRLIREFGIDWYKTNVRAEFLNRMRQAVRKHGMNEVAIETTAIDDIDREVSEAMEDYLKSANIPVRLIQVTVGKANPPDAIKTQRIETATQQQAILTQQQRKKAEDERLAAEQSRANADRVYQLEMKLSTDQFVMLEWFKTFREVCHGAKCTIVTNGGVTPVIPVGK